MKTGYVQKVNAEKLEKRRIENYLIKSNAELARINANYIKMISDVLIDIDEVVYTARGSVSRNDYVILDGFRRKISERYLYFKNDD